MNDFIKIAFSNENIWNILQYCKWIARSLSHEQVLAQNCYQNILTNMPNWFEFQVKWMDLTVDILKTYRPM